MQPLFSNKAQKIPTLLGCGFYWRAGPIGEMTVRYSKFVLEFTFQCLCAHSSIVSDAGIKMICTAITNLITLLYFLNHEME